MMNDLFLDVLTNFAKSNGQIKSAQDEGRSYQMHFADPLWLQMLIKCTRGRLFIVSLLIPGMVIALRLLLCDDRGNMGRRHSVCSCRHLAWSTL